jgi:hypothetical protein
VKLDYVVTAEEAIDTRRSGEQPAGIYWDELPGEKIDAIPVLAALKEA